MSAAIVPRMALRQSRWALQRRAASTTSEAASTAQNAASKAQSAAKDYAGKAQEGLSKVTTSAGSALNSAAGAAGKAVSGIGGRTGATISFVQGLVPPTIYYARVAGELAKTIVHQRGMYPPSMQTVQSYLQPLQNAFRNPSTILNRTASQAGQAAEKTATTAVNNPEALLSRVRNMDSAALTSVAIVAAEVLGFFTVGEMIGRFKIVGYRSSAPHGEH